MNEFVNYGTRTVTLPDGCTDLIDVLRDKASRIPAEPPTVMMERVPERGLASVEKYVQRLFTSQKNLFLIVYHDPVEAACILQRGEQGKRISFRLKPPDIFRAEQLRRICGEAGLLPIRDGVVAGDQFLEFAMPASIPEATLLVERLLQEVYRVSPDAGLIFHLIG